MADSKFFGIPFASTGDREAIPDTTDPSGAVSYQEGFGPDYERDPATDPLAKRVPRAETNEYIYQLSNALKFLQLFGIPEWFPDDGLGAPVSYPRGARVRYDAGAGMRMWRSLVDANTFTPGANFAQWTPYEEGAFLGVQRFTSSGVYTPTPGTREIIVEVIGAGGGGGGARATSVNFYAGGAGGGGGGGAISRIPVPSSPVAVSVGAGGAPGVGANPAGAGGDSGFGALLSASGGAGGGGTLSSQSASGTVEQQAGGAGGAGVGGNLINSRGGPGGNLLLSRLSNNTAGGGGSSPRSGGPRGHAGTTGPGLTGSLGSGGSGALSENGGPAQSGGVGGAGFVWVFEYA